MMPQCTLFSNYGRFIFYIERLSNVIADFELVDADTTYHFLLVLFFFAPVRTIKVEVGSMNNLFAKKPRMSTRHDSCFRLACGDLRVIKFERAMSVHAITCLLGNPSPVHMKTDMWSM